MPPTIPRGVSPSNVSAASPRLYGGGDVAPPREESHVPARQLPRLQEGHLPGLRQARRPGTRGSARVAAVQLRPPPHTPVRRPARLATPPGGPPPPPPPSRTAQTTPPRLPHRPIP